MTGLLVAFWLYVSLVNRALARVETWRLRSTAVISRYVH
jgi:hypothetical protein